MKQTEDIKCVSTMRGNDEPLLMKSKSRVQKHGEIFTPQWVVDKMLSIPGIKEKAENIFATFLEPSAGEGAFLLAIENMRLQFVLEQYNKEQWSTYALWALSSIYGIEFLEDNLVAAQQNMLDLFAVFYEAVHGEPLTEESELYKSVRTIIRANIVQGNTLTRKNHREEEIIFSCWSQVPEKPRMVERSTFTYSSLFTESMDGKAYVKGSVFNMFEQSSEDAAPAEYAVVDIEQVWREEKDND